MTTLQIAWFCIIGLLLTVYMLLDGYDLGVGFWHLFAKSREDKSALMTTILPFWDGNEVWLVTAGAAVFAAFPNAYATVFSGFYLALMLLLCALILRAVSIEFMFLVSASSKGFWEKIFGITSIVPALLFGVAMGNLLRGLTLDSQMNFTGNFFTLLNPYSLLIGVTGLVMFITHGGLWAALHTKDDLARHTRSGSQKSWTVFLVLFVICAVATIMLNPSIAAQYKGMPVMYLMPVLALISIIMTGYLNSKNQSLGAFAASSASIIILMITIASTLFPDLVPAINNPAHSLNIVNSSSSQLSLKAMLIVTSIGLPIVIGYSIWIHMAFLKNADGGNLEY